MDTIIKEEPWHFVCFDRDGEVFLTYMVQTGPVTVDYTVKLQEPEVASLKSGLLDIKGLLASFEPSRHIVPTIWPQNNVD